MFDEGEKLVPGFREARALRVWAGARPLYTPGRCRRHARRQPHPHRARPREARRRRGLHHDHRRQDDDLPADGRACGRRRLRAARRQSTCAGRADEPLPGSEDGALLLARRAGSRQEPVPNSEEIICECELITRSHLTEGDRPRRPTLESRRRPPQGPARDGSVPGRFLHLPGDRHPPRVRAPRPRSSELRAARLSPGAVEGRRSRSCTATSSARRAWTTGSSGPARGRAPARMTDVRARPAGASYDTVVIGAGLAGLTAALRLADAAAARGRPRQRRRRNSSRASHDRRPRLRERTGRQPGAGAAPVRRREPAAPYRQLSIELLRGSLELVQDPPERDQAYRGGLDENFFVPTAVGGPRSSDGAPAGDDGPPATFDRAAASSSSGFAGLKVSFPPTSRTTLLEPSGRGTRRSPPAWSSSRRRSAGRVTSARWASPGVSNRPISRRGSLTELDPQSRPGRDRRLSGRARDRGAGEVWRA